MMGAIQMRVMFQVSVVLIAIAAGVEAAQRPNVLFIAVDDLRPQLGCYGLPKMRTPNIDRLASQSILFERAYCMVPTCGASRASLMTGIRPSRNRFVNYLAWAEKDAPGVTTLNQHFRNHGYCTLSNGKVFHHATDSNDGWSEPAWRPRRVATYQLAESLANLKTTDSRTGRRRRGPPYESADVSDDTYADGQIAAKGVSDLRRLARKEEPFFLAVGFLKPHLPFVAPKKYWDMYDYQEIQLPTNYHRPTDAPDQAIHSSGELRSYAGVPEKGPLSDEMARTLIHGYYACVSYTDANVGMLLDELDRLQLADNTIVVLWGDHGWNLGEHTLWCKHCCFETSMHAPLIVRAPKIQGGQKTRGLTEFIDIYPSLCELADLPLPEHLQGRSFVSLMKDPDRDWKDAAIGRYRGGDTMRTDHLRFTEYTDASGRYEARMLYDHREDPGENANIAEQESRRAIVKALTQQLHERMGKDADLQDDAD